MMYANFQDFYDTSQSTALPYTPDALSLSFRIALENVLHFSSGTHHFDPPPEYTRDYIL
jgi:hypothetical protein